MRIVLVITGIAIALLSMIGYAYTPTAVSQVAHSMLGMAGSSSSSPMSTSSMLHSMGYPSRSTIVPVMQYSFIGLEVAGMGLAMYGFIAKKPVKKGIAKKNTNKEELEVEESPNNLRPTNENSLTNYSAIRRLQERLANGEIMASEFERIKKLLE
jgi:hypothetical protein